jgi:hypothetical protein
MHTLAPSTDEINSYTRPHNKIFIPDTKKETNNSNVNR